MTDCGPICYATFFKALTLYFATCLILNYFAYLQYPNSIGFSLVATYGLLLILMMNQTCFKGGSVCVFKKYERFHLIVSVVSSIFLMPVATCVLWNGVPQDTVFLNWIVFVSSEIWPIVLTIRFFTERRKRKCQIDKNNQSTQNNQNSKQNKSVSMVKNEQQAGVINIE